MSASQIYLLSLLGADVIPVRRRLPCRNKTTGERFHDVCVDPISFMYGLSSEEDFEAAKRLFDTQNFLLDDGLSVKKFHAQLIARFDKAFEHLGEAYEMSHPAPFVRRHLSCEPEVIKEFEALAKQGHIISQYIAGLLLTTMAGDFDPSGIQYLLMAYENRFPRTMDALAEYLLYREDYLGAIQCSLLSIDSLDNSKSTMSTICGHAADILIDHPSQSFYSTMPLLDYIFQHALDDQFKALAKKHFPEFYPSQEEIERDVLNRILRR